MFKDHVQVDGLILQKELEDTFAEGQVELLAGDLAPQSRFVEPAIGRKNPPGTQAMIANLTLRVKVGITLSAEQLSMLRPYGNRPLRMSNQ